MSFMAVRLGEIQAEGKELLERIDDEEAIARLQVLLQEAQAILSPSPPPPPPRRPAMPTYWRGFRPGDPETPWQSLRAIMRKPPRPLVLGFVIGFVVVFALLMLWAYDWDPRCLVADCRRVKR